MQKSSRLLDAFIASLKNNVRTDDTIYQYTSTLRNAERFFVSNFNISIFDKEDLPRLEIDHIDEWVTHIREADISLSSRSNYYYRMRSYLRWLKARNLVDESFIGAVPSLNAAVERQRVTDPAADMQKVYSDEDIVTMLQIAQSHKNPLVAARNAALIAMFAGTGMRSVEVLSLTVGDYRAAASTHVLPNVKRKGSKYANIPFASFVVPYVDRYLSIRAEATDADPLFAAARVGHNGTPAPLSRSDARTSIAAIQKKAGVRTGLHNFRHTVVSRIVETNPSGVAMVIAGHSSSRVTDEKYVHTDDATRRSVVDSLSINQLLSKNT